MSIADDAVVTYRARGLRAAMGIIGLWGQASATSTILEARDQVLWQDLLVAAAAAAFFLGLIAYRVGWACITVKASGVVVRNPFRRYEVPWSEVVGFTWGNVGLIPKVAVKTRGGQIPVAGLPVSGGQPGGSVADALAALNAHHVQWGSRRDAEKRPEDHRADDDGRPPLRVLGALLGGITVAAVVKVAGGLDLTLDPPAVWACAAIIGYAALVYIASRPLLRDTSKAPGPATGQSTALVMALAVVAGGAVAGLLSDRSAPLLLGVAMSIGWIALVGTARRRTSRALDR